MTTQVYLGEDYNNETFPVEGPLEFKVLPGSNYDNITFSLDAGARDVDFGPSGIQENATVQLASGEDYTYQFQDGSVLVQLGGETVTSLSVGSDGKTFAEAKIGGGDAVNIEVDPDTGEVIEESEPVDPVPEPGETFTLTEGEDNFTGNPDANDTFNAPVNEDGNQTIDDFDTLNGVSGTNT